MRSWIVVFCVVHLAVGAGACAKAQAKNSPEGPPLQVPDPPPHVIVPAEEPLASAPAVPEAPPTTAPAPPGPARPAARRTTETEPREPVPPPPPPPAQPPPEPPRALRSAPSAQDAAAERAVRDTMARAARDLNRVDYGKLSVEGRAQYEQSKRFSQQAEEALKDRNFVFASTLADKAATLAAELLGR
jgi:type IV secretory pathway VirB10-like protein